MDNIKERIKKVLTLAQKGATEGERAAAQAAFDRLAQKYGLEDENIIERKGSTVVAVWKYRYHRDMILFHQIVEYLIDGRCQEKVRFTTSATGGRCQEIGGVFEYLDYITVDCAFGYFKPHMNAQYRKVVVPSLNSLPKRTRSKVQPYLLTRFMSSYIIKSGLCDPSDVRKEAPDDITDEEYAAAVIADRIEGGRYSTQVQGDSLAKLN